MHRTKSAGGLLTLARDLKRRKARERTDHFVSEGLRAVGELAASGITVQGVICTTSGAASPRAAALIKTLAGRGVPVVRASDADFASAAGTGSPQGILAIAAVPRRDIAALGAADLARVLVLDAIQDPGNVGALIRTAAALGVRTVVALPGTADPWNAKVVRSAAGGHFHVIVTQADPATLFAALSRARTPLWGADARGRPLGEMTATASLALALGNEGAGLTPDVRGAAAELVALPMTDGVESLNVAVAAGILLYALRP
jgi:TrmH family RNA methyltransferase